MEPLSSDPASAAASSNVMRSAKNLKQSALEQALATSYSTPIETKWATSLMIYIPCFFALLFSARELEMLGMRKLEDQSDQAKKLITLSEKSYNVACAFAMKQNVFIFFFVSLMCCIITVFVSRAAMFAFLAGSLATMCCAHLGMKCSFAANLKASYFAVQGGSAGSLPEAFAMVIKGATVNGLLCVSIAVVAFYSLMLSLAERGWLHDHPRSLFEAMVGYAWGASTVALFMRAGSGVFANSASLGADATAQRANLGEDDPKNSAVLADNVGDMVLGVGATSADFASWFAESTVVGMVILSAYLDMTNLSHNWAFISYPIMLFSTGTFVAIPTIFACRSMFAVSDAASIGRALSMIKLIGTLVQTGTVIGINYLVTPYNLPGFVSSNDLTRWDGLAPVIIGLWFGFIVATISNYFTSSTFQPVHRIASGQEISAATGIIFGLANGYMSCVIPTILFGATMISCFRVAGMYGVAMAMLGMLSSLTLRLTVHSFGPIADNARGVASMAKVRQEALDALDILDNCGKEAANGSKSFAFGSVSFTALAIFVAYCERTGSGNLDMLDSWTFIGLLLGTLQPFLFSSILLKSVGVTAQKVLLDALNQLQNLTGDSLPDYQTPISICTTAGIVDMISMGLLLELPLFVGMVLGSKCTAGFMVGTMASGVMLALSMNSSGASWESAKRYIKGPPKTNGLPPAAASAVSSAQEAATPASAARKEKPKGLDNAGIGECVGYSTKEVVGPALNVFIKVTGITALLFSQTIVNGSNVKGGPFFIKQ